MKTLEELKSMGFHGKNLILAPDVRFSFNVRTRQIVASPKIEDDEVLNLILSLQKIEKKGYEAEIKEINAAKLVAWFPCEDGKSSKMKYIKYIILVDENDKDLSETIEYYCGICKEFKTLLHKHVIT